ncbi:unnamed protein product, partial [Rotaria sordida]
MPPKSDTRTAASFVSGAEELRNQDAHEVSPQCK